jgi:hypothetical protein
MLLIEIGDLIAIAHALDEIAITWQACLHKENVVGGQAKRTKWNQSASSLL